MSFDHRLNFIRLDKEKNLTLFQRFTMFMQGIKYRRRLLSEPNLKNLMYYGIYSKNGVIPRHKQEFNRHEFLHLNNDFMDEFEVPLAIETNFSQEFNNLYYPAIYFSDNDSYREFDAHTTIDHIKISLSNYSYDHNKCWVIPYAERKPILQWGKYLRSSSITNKCSAERSLIRNNCHNTIWDIQTRTFKSFFIPAFPYGRIIPEIVVVNKINTPNAVLHEIRNILLSYFNSPFMTNFISHYQEYVGTVVNNDIGAYQTLETHRKEEQESDINRLLGIATEVARSRELERNGYSFTELPAIYSPTVYNSPELIGGSGESLYTDVTITTNLNWDVPAKNKTKKAKKKTVKKAIVKKEVEKEEKPVENKGDNPILDLEL